MFMNRRTWFLKGMRAGIPICLGYFAVSIALGIAAKKAGITSFQAALTSLLINASAGEYAGFSLGIGLKEPERAHLNVDTSTQALEYLLKQLT